MTGDDVKQKAIVTLRSHVWNMPSPEAAEEACAEALAALYPCVVLTAEEAKFMRSRIGWYSRSLKLERDDDALALLTPNQEPDPIIPGYGSSI